MSSLNQLGGRLLVVYDGHCGLCNGSVRWLLRRDQRDRLRFVPSESSKVAELLERHGYGAAEAGPETILVVRNAGEAGERVLERSDAVLALLAELPGAWSALAAGLGWIPRPLRDIGYRLVARGRYRIWGRFKSCPLPTAAERGRFL